MVPCPNKIVLCDTTSALSIEKGRTPVRGLRPKFRPFVIVAKLSIPITFRDCFLLMSHFASVKFCELFSGGNNFERRSFRQIAARVRQAR
jgi:hypothetical protein